MADMGGTWPEVALGEVLASVDRAETPTVGKTYRTIGVKWWGEGVYERETIDGSQTQYSTFHRIQTNDIIINKIWARHGSVAVVQSALNGSYASTEFPTWTAQAGKLEPQWIHWLSKTKGFWDQCDEKSRGTSGKNRIRPEKFLEIEIPLPPLEEQRRIVARVEAMAGRIAEAREARRVAGAEAEGLWRAELNRTFSDETGERITLEEVCAEIIDNLHSNPVISDTGIPCIRSSDVGWGKLVLKTAQKTSEEEYQRRTVRGEPQTDDIVLVREGGGTGKAAVVAEGQRFSLGQRVMMLRPDTNKIEAKYLLYQMLSPTVYDEQIVPLSKGSASPHLNIAALRKFRLFVPSLETQRNILLHLDRLRTQLDELKRQQAESEAELEALLPSLLDRAFRGEL